MINFQKFKVFISNNVSNSRESIMKNLMGMELIKDLGKYLSIPLKRGRATKDTYKYMLDKIQSCFTNWKANYLSLVGRATLMQDTLTAIPNYLCLLNGCPNR